MRVLVMGATGQLGWELQRSCPSSIIPIFYDLPEVDFCNMYSIRQCIRTVQPDCIINAAAYTDVDKAEQEPELADRINRTAVCEIAKYCQQNNIFLIHVSTNFVFNGYHFKPYQPEDTPGPESIYGQSKLAGEQALIRTMDSFLIIRTAWLYSAHGNNFVKTMLKLMREKTELAIIDEQISTPTWAFGLAGTIWKSLIKNIQGIYHWTDAGVASWYDFAIAIQEESLQLNLLEKAIPIYPITSSRYPSLAKRPLYSVLDKSSFWQKLNITPVHWRVYLREMLKELKERTPK